MAILTSEIVGFLPGLKGGELVQIGGGIYRYDGVKDINTDPKLIFAFVKVAE